MENPSRNCGHASRRLIEHSSSPQRPIYHTRRRHSRRNHDQGSPAITSTSRAPNGIQTSRASRNSATTSNSATNHRSSDHRGMRGTTTIRIRTRTSDHFVKWTRSIRITITRPRRGTRTNSSERRRNSISPKVTRSATSSPNISLIRFHQVRTSSRSSFRNVSTHYRKSAIRSRHVRQHLTPFPMKRTMSSRHHRQHPNGNYRKRNPGKRNFHYQLAMGRRWCNGTNANVSTRRTKTNRTVLKGDLRGHPQRKRTRTSRRNRSKTSRTRVRSHRPLFQHPISRRSTSRLIVKGVHGTHTSISSRSDHHRRCRSNSAGTVEVKTRRFVPFQLTECGGGNAPVETIATPENVSGNNSVEQTTVSTTAAEVTPDETTVKAALQ